MTAQNSNESTQTATESAATPYSQLKRTHNLGELSASDIGTSVRLNGWVQEYRNLGGVLFLDLRDRYGVTQVTVNPKDVPEATHKAAAAARHEDVVAAIGIVQKRPDGSQNKKLSTGEIEIVVEHFELLNPSKTPPFEITDKAPSNENLRLEYRFLDLRRNPMQKLFRIRHEVTMAVREKFSEMGFLEIETPLLMRSTPEGARDYVVPSRVHPGKFFALPQSPQLLKQILMVSGFDKYFQLARCLRDEDLRSDRQPEHTQIDVEMSFVTPDDVFTNIENMLKHVFKEVQKYELEIPFPRYTYDEVMSRWGIDKPDLRFDMELVDLTDAVADCEFKVFRDNVAKGGTVKALTLKGGGSYSRKHIDELTDFAKEQGAGGLAYVLRGDESDKSPILKFIGEELKDKLCEIADCQKGDSLLIISDKPNKTESILGQLRLHLAKKHDLIDKSRNNFLWVTEFPLFEYDEEAKRWDAMHNIVSHPIESEMHMLAEGENSKLDPTDQNHPWRKIHAAQYDLVYNGSEIASGGIRINTRELQQRVLNVLGISNERSEQMFGFLLRALEYGAPPHGGVALGLDRLVANMCGVDSIREVIAFPKTAAATALMEGAPSVLEPEQLEELSLKIESLKTKPLKAMSLKAKS